MTLPILILDPSAAARLKLWFFRADALFPGASPWMILVHLAVLNGLSARELDALFHARGALRRQTFDRGLTRPVWAHAQLADALNIPANVLRPASGFPAYSPAARFTACSLRFCPQCLKQAVHSVLYQWTFVLFCPVHRTPLTTACPGCAQPIAYRLNTRTFKYPGRCPHCLYRLITAAAIERLAVISPAFLKTLLRLTLELSAYVRHSEDTREIEGLAAWLRCLPATSPSLQLSNPIAGAFPARPTPGFYHPRCLSATHEAERCYRSIRRCLWRRLSRAQQHTLSSWARRHAHPLATPVAASLDNPPLALLFWRLFWEGRSNPLTLFRHSRAPYTSLLVWLLRNPDDETRPSVPPCIRRKSAPSLRPSPQPINRVRQSLRICSPSDTSPGITPGSIFHFESKHTTHSVCALSNPNGTPCELSSKKRRSAKVDINNYTLLLRAVYDLLIFNYLFFSGPATFYQI